MSQLDLIEKVLLCISSVTVPFNRTLETSLLMLSNMVAISNMWLPSTWNVVNVTEELKFKLNLNLNNRMWLWLPYWTEQLSNNYVVEML